MYLYDVLFGVSKKMKIRIIKTVVYTISFLFIAAKHSLIPRGRGNMKLKMQNESDCVYCKNSCE